MSIIEWIEVTILLLVWLGSLITVWVKINIKLAELEIKINGTTEKLISHEKWGMAQQELNERKMHSIECDLRDNYKELNFKLDKILEYLNDFKIEVERRIK